MVIIIHTNNNMEQALVNMIIRDVVCIRKDKKHQELVGRYYNDGEGTIYKDSDIYVWSEDLVMRENYGSWHTPWIMIRAGAW